MSRGFELSSTPVISFQQLIEMRIVDYFSLGRDYV
jgi:hypothetical protein